MPKLRFESEFGVTVSSTGLLNLPSLSPLYFYCVHEKPHWKWANIFWVLSTLWCRYLHSNIFHDMAFVLQPWGVWKRVNDILNSGFTLYVKMIVISLDCALGQDYMTVIRKWYLIMKCKRWDHHFHRSGTYIPRLLMPSSQVSSLGGESASPKMLPCSQDLEALRSKREERERWLLFFFLNILGRNENSE